MQSVLGKKKNLVTLVHLPAHSRKIFLSRSTTAHIGGKTTALDTQVYFVCPVCTHRQRNGREPSGFFKVKILKSTEQGVLLPFTYYIQEKKNYISIRKHLVHIGLSLLNYGKLIFFFSNAHGFLCMYEPYCLNIHFLGFYAKIMQLILSFFGNYLK